MKIMGVQDFFKVGHTQENLTKILHYIEQAKEQHVDLLVFPELTLTGYFPHDLLYRTEYQAELHLAFKTIQAATQGIAILLGHPLVKEEGLYNALSVIENHEIRYVYCKRCLPNTEVFDEKRYFLAGQVPGMFAFKGLRLGVAICEDIWHPETIQSLATEQPDALLVINASPFAVNKLEVRTSILLPQIARSLRCPLLYLNTVGAHDDLVFDGGSMAFNHLGQQVSQAPWFEPALWTVFGENTSSGWDILPEKMIPAPPSVSQRIYQALVLAIQAYCAGNGFKTLLLGLSGGIDSALTLALAVDALGADKVRAVFLPSRYTRPISESAAIEQCQILGVPLETISIEPLVTATTTALNDIVQKMNTLTAQNIQARARALLLMALSNQTGALLLTTGNKSEYAQGYCTLYGDMAGGFAPLKDVYKMQVYELAQYRNSLGACIPEIVITRAPSAELAEDQYDADHLPPYDVLDTVLHAYLEEGLAPEEIIEQGFDRQLVQKIIQTLYKNEYKRQQAPIGPKISTLAFDRERRYPITLGFSF